MTFSSASFSTARVSRAAATTHAYAAKKHFSWPAFYTADEANGGQIG